MLPWAHSSPNIRWHLAQFSGFCTAHCRVSLYITLHVIFTLQWATPSLKIAPSHGASGSTSNTWGSPGPFESLNKRYLDRLRSFLLGSLVCQTDRKTDRPGYLVCDNRPHLRTSFPGQPGQSGTSKVKAIWILMKQEMMGCNGINWTICKSFAPWSRQIITPAPHHTIFIARRSYASAVLGFVILSVRLSHACFVTNPKNLLVIFFIPRERAILLVSCHPTVVGGRRPLPPKMGDRSDPPPSKITHVNKFPPSKRNFSPVRDSKLSKRRAVSLL